MFEIPSSWMLLEYAEVESTQDVAKEKIASGQIKKKFVVRADHQTKGRGRSGRTWSSLSGNLQATLVLPMTFDVRIAANYSFLSAVALSSVVQDFCDTGARSPKIEHKWPNDVWVDDRKLAGILLEVYKNHLLIGVGVNVSEAPEGAASLNQFCQGSMLDVSGFLASFLGRIDSYSDLMLGEGFDPIRERWLARARGLGEVITVRTLTETFHGVFDGIEPDGALRVLIEGRDSPRIVHSADVFFGKEEGFHVARN